MSTVVSQIFEAPVETVMRDSYLTYAVSVITDRALPDVRDGLKPVHRRILFAMHNQHLSASSAFRKSARVVGDVIGKYHPHGDTAVYDAMVRMAQPWTLLHPLVDGQGNFGSVDGDRPAAMRYTEVRMRRLADALFADIEKDTVEFRDNYDGAEREPVVLPAAYPNVLVNGADGIAVGMATRVLPHNLGEVIDAFEAYVNNPEITPAELLQYMPAPDFPTGGLVYDLDGYAQALAAGRGRIRLRAKWHEETRKQGVNLVIDELPYQVNKAQLVEAIGALVKERQVEDVADLRDESDKGGVRIVIELKRGAMAEVVFNQLAAVTALDIALSYNVMLLLGQQPLQMGFIEIFKHFLEFRLEVVRRRVQFDLQKAQARLHILDGLMRALNALDEVIALVRSTPDGATARAGLQDLLGLDAGQAQAILDLRLQKLTGMELSALRAEFDAVTAQVAECQAILADPARQQAMVLEDASAVRAKFAQPRCTEIAHHLSTLDREDLVPCEPVLIPVTRGGYLKRIPARLMNAQHRNTRGKSWMVLGDTDFVESVYTGSTHDVLLAMTQTGQLHARKVYQLPEGGANTKGRHVRNIFEDLQGEIQTILTVPAFSDEWYLLSVSAKGQVKRTALSHYLSATRKGGVQGVLVDDGDRIAAVAACREGDHVLLVSSAGKAIRFRITADEVRPMGRVAGGVRGIRLEDDAEVVGLVVLPQGEDVGQLLCIGANGVGKRTPVSEFQPQTRGGVGVSSFNINSKTGPLVRAMAVVDSDDLVMITDSGVSNRIRVESIRLTGRIASGSFLMNLDQGDRIVDAVAVVPEPDEGDPEEDGSE